VIANINKIQWTKLKSLNMPDRLQHAWHACHQGVTCAMYGRPKYVLPLQLVALNTVIWQPKRHNSIAM